MIEGLDTYHQTVQSDSAPDFEILLPQHSPNDISHRNDPYNVLILYIILCDYGVRVRRKRRNDAPAPDHISAAFLSLPTPMIMIHVTLTAAKLGRSFAHCTHLKLLYTVWTITYVFTLLLRHNLLPLESHKRVAVKNHTNRNKNDFNEWDVYHVYGGQTEPRGPVRVSRRTGKAINYYRAV